MSTETIRVSKRVLDFVKYLLLKIERGDADRDAWAWSDLSLSLAMRGMEDEDTPDYSTADLKEVFT